ncbi:MAG: hypothetical protein QXD72_01865 [Candidatus Aenigmatarchaeota archaeon]
MEQPRMGEWFLTAPNIPDNPHMIIMLCPRCGSERTSMISLTFPKTFECGSCGHIFLESKKALIDE